MTLDAQVGTQQVDAEDSARYIGGAAIGARSNLARLHRFSRARLRNGERRRSARRLPAARWPSFLGIYEELVMSIRAGARAPFWRALLRLDIRAALNRRQRAISSRSPGRHRRCYPYPGIRAGVAAGEPTRDDLELLLRAGAGLDRYRPQAHSPLDPCTLYAALIAGAVGAYFLVGAVPVQTPETAWFLFLSGMGGHLRHDPCRAFPAPSFWCFWANTSLCWPPVNQRDIVSLPAFSASARSSAS